MVSGTGLLGLSCRKRGRETDVVVVVVNRIGLLHLVTLSFRFKLSLRLKF